MFLRKVRPADEEFSNAAVLIAFTAVWYGLLIRGVVSGKTEWMNAALFMVFGLLPVYTAYNKVRNILACRKKRKEAISLGKCFSGTIDRVVVERVPYNLKHGRISYKTMYYLMIIKEENELGISSEIKSDAYRFPVPYYLESTKVKLYPDASGWKWYVEELKCSRWRKKESLFKADGCIEDGWREQNLLKVIFIIWLTLIFMKNF